MRVAYPLMSLDMVGVELGKPFSEWNLSHLPLNDISATIERNARNIAKVPSPAPQLSESSGPA